MGIVTYAFDITDRTRATDGTYRFVTVAVTLPVEEGTSDLDAHFAAFDFSPPRWGRWCSTCAS
jgi:hypothetical protein